MQRGNRHSNLGAQPLPGRLWWGSARPLLEKVGTLSTLPPSRYRPAHPSSPHRIVLEQPAREHDIGKKRKKTKTQMYIVSPSPTVGSEWRDSVIARCNPSPLVTVWWWLRLRAAALRRWGSDVKETSGLAASSRHNNASASPVCLVQSSPASAFDQRPPLVRHIVSLFCPTANIGSIPSHQSDSRGVKSSDSPCSTVNHSPKPSSNPTNLGNHHTASAP